jgi:Mg2+ and Co2+ transporter CorA
MNLDYMPELQWTLEYPLALLMLLVSVTIFKGRGWL